MPLIIKDEYPEKLLREDGKRLDGRDLKEVRPIKMEVGVIKSADGSAYLEWGDIRSSLLSMDPEKFIHIIYLNQIEGF